MGKFCEGPEPDHIKKHYETVPEVHVEDDGTIWFCPLRLSGRTDVPCRRMTGSRRDYPDNNTCGSGDPELQVPRRVALPDPTKTAELFQDNKFVTVDSTGTILFDAEAARKARCALYAQPSE